MLKKKLSIKLLLSVTALCLFTVISIGATFAWFTSSPAIESNNFQTGKLTVSLTGENDASTIDLSGANLIAPGEVAATPTVINIKNSGNKDLGWFGRLVYAGTDSLKDFLYINSMQMEFFKPTSGTWEATDIFITDGVPSGDYASTMGSIIDPVSGKVTLRKWMGNGLMAPGLGYENMGALKPGYSYRLTFTLGLLGSADNSFQEQAVNLSYEVTATQLNAAALDNLFAGAGVHLVWMNQQIAKQ